MFFRKSDVIIISIILVFSLIFTLIYKNLFSNQKAKAEIYYNSTLVQTIDLNLGIDKTFSIPQNNNIVFHLFKDGSIKFEESDCPDKICINSGKLKTIGESAACLPNNTILKIVPENKHNDDDFDIIP